jgi:Uma2 family endonuclease
VLDAAAVARERVRPLRRAEYDRLVELGVFDDERIELLYGVLVAMSPIHAPHAEGVRRTHERLVIALAGRARVQSQSPLGVTEDSEPEPDVAVIANGDYSRAHPTTAFLVVEVADSSLAKDRTVKARLYAEAGIPEYWIVNVIDGVIERHTEPQGGVYGIMTRHARGERIAMVAFPDVVVEVAAILPTA